MKRYLLMAVYIMLAGHTKAQVFTNKEIGKKNTALADSLKKADYPYALPIWGKKVTKMGYSLPYSAGLSINYFSQKSDLVIDNLMVGFNNGQMYNMDGLVRFNKAQSTASSVSIRPDIWLLPFLNVYGIMGKATASTDVGVGLWIPDSSNTEKEILSLNSKVDFNATTFGFGMTPTIGVGGGFLALDMNCAWTDAPQLYKPTFTFVFAPRLGKNLKFKKEGQSLAVWAGAFRVMISSGTNGSIALADVLPIPEMQEKVDAGIDNIADKQQQVDLWWDGLSAVEQKNPVNIAKYNSANMVLDKAGQILNAADVALSNVSSTVQFSMDKRPENKWNFIMGSQFQLNKHWMVRAEYGFLNSRTQFMAGLQYRFGL